MSATIGRRGALRLAAQAAFVLGCAACSAAGTTNGGPAAAGGSPETGTTPIAGTSASPGANSSPGSSPGGHASAAPTATASGGSSVTSGGPLCLPVTPASSLAPPQTLRFGIDPGEAGNLVPVTTTTPLPVDTNAQNAALAGLQPGNGPLVIRLNRLFWSGGDALLQQFASEATSFAQMGYDVEVQVRYHPTTAEIDQIAEWVAYVRHVVDVLGPNKNLVALTITNEVNFDVSPNTSDGFYPGAQSALVQGIEAAAAEAQKDG